jgi:hypothetical protein
MPKAESYSNIPTALADLIVLFFFGVEVLLPLQGWQVLRESLDLMLR